MFRSWSNRSTHLLVASVAVFGLIAASCGSSEGAVTTTEAASDTTATAVSEVVTSEATAVSEVVTSEATDSSESPAASGEVVVFAAASLTEAFTELGDAFDSANPDAVLTFNFAASSDLVAQITEGAPADVYASADMKNMTKLTDAGENGAAPVVFANNLSEIIVAPGNPLGISGVEDLANEDLIVVTCALEVPCGAYATQIFDNAGVTVQPASFEENVKAVVTKVILGEADAGIAYATDVTAAGDDADGVEIPADLNVVADYPIVVTAAAPNPEAAQAFVDFVLSEAGQAILASYGFTSP